MEDIRIIDRIARIKLHFGLTAKELSQSVGISDRTISDYFSGKTEPKLSFVTSILDKYPSVSAEWLLRGNGSMLLTESATCSQNESDAIYYTRLAQIRQKRIAELEEQLARLQAV